jgi:hypothetical protein
VRSEQRETGQRQKDERVQFATIIDNQKNTLAFLLWCVAGATFSYCKDGKQTTCVVAAVSSLIRDNAAQLAGSDATSEISVDLVVASAHVQTSMQTVYIYAGVTGLSSQFTGNAKIDFRFDTTSSLPRYVDSCYFFFTVDTGR